MCLFTPQILLGTHPAYHRGMAQAALGWFTHPKTVIHPGTNRARRKVTTVIETNALPLSQTGNRKPNKCETLLETQFSKCTQSTDHLFRFTNIQQQHVGSSEPHSSSQAAVREIQINSSHFMSQVHAPQHYQASSANHDFMSLISKTDRIGHSADAHLSRGRLLRQS